MNTFPYDWTPRFACAIAFAAMAIPLTAQSTPPPGSLYREFARHNGGNLDWRVTDHEAVKSFERARQFLPNPRWEIEVSDLRHAVRAEALIERWGGHRGTINKRIRFNDHAWIIVPELREVPEGLRPEMLMYQDNPVVEIPLEHLQEGTNVFDADCDEEGGFGWGQWGLYSLILRVYYDREAKQDEVTISGKITSPTGGQIVGDHPRIDVTAQASSGVARIDVIASYDGYDEDGDGSHGGWHETHFQVVRGEPNALRDHVGTLWRRPYQLTWDTHWVPDQKPHAVSLVARIQDSRGYWLVSEVVDRLSLMRWDETVKLYTARGMTEGHGVRHGQTKECFFDLPADASVGTITEAALHLRSWHGWDGHHDPIRINDDAMPIDGKNHFYDYDLLPVPAESLRSGENIFRVHSETEHHQLEVLWPGPAIVTRAPKPAVTIGDGKYQQRDHFVIETPRATYWLDKRSGGLSRLIDRAGSDWIAFKQQPWDQYPESAASSYRGIPNLVHGRSETGFGHPGWDVATSRQVDPRTIISTSLSGKWQLRWEFSATDVQLTVESTDGDTPYWFLYEGPIAGRWAPQRQYIATDSLQPTSSPHDYLKGDRRFERWRWAYLGDRDYPRVLFFHHDQYDEALDTFAQLGNSREGLGSEDGMVVFGFGRGVNGVEPLLRGINSFRIGLLEQSGDDMMSYEAIRKYLSSVSSPSPVSSPPPVSSPLSVDEATGHAPD